MPGGSKKKKKFIDKKNCQKFYLLNRSQRDPLTADERAPQHVLFEHIQRQNGPMDEGGQEWKNSQARKEEQQKYSIFFDDDYNYLQHLKDLKEVSLLPVAVFDMSDAKTNHFTEAEGKAKLTLPSSVFASNVEEEIGLLNRAAPIRGPQPDLDPDIIAALDSDCDASGNADELEDDFVIKANAETGDSDSEDSDDKYSSENQDIASDGSNCSEETSSFEGTMHTEEETKSRFTNYSMSSSVLRRNEGLTLLDDRFEKIFEEYDEEQIGALDNDDIDGIRQPGDVLLEHVIENFKTGQTDSELSDLRREARIAGSENENLTDTSSDSGEDAIVKMVIEEPAGKWDCESILSTYSNLYNHPKLIKEPSKPIKVSRKTGLPIGVISDSGLTAAALKSLDAETSIPQEPSTASRSVSKRDKDETKEEKRNRKQAVKEQRKERRVEKKANTLAFKEEKKKQAKVMLNLQQNMKGIKLS